MSKPFLQHIIDDIQVSDLAKLKDTCYVFPTKRACLHFTKRLADKFQDKPFWMPEALSIEDFVIEQSGRTLANDLTLMFELFNTYRTYDKSIQFETFYAWGQVLLRDFDEIDRYMIEADKVYQNLQEIRDIEAVFGPDPQILEALKQFQQVIDVTEETPLLQSFKTTWALVGKVYNAFNQRLSKINLAYSGACYKTFAESLKNGYSTPYNHVVFAGFNATSKAEELIFKQLIEQEKATIYWDADEFYLKNEKIGASKFLDRHRKKWKSDKSKWIVSDGFNVDKKIEIIGAVQNMAQAKIASILLNDFNGDFEQNTAIVLADESLLYPIIYALPPMRNALNVTMGYPIKLTGYYDFSLAFIKLHANAKNGFFQRELLQQLQHMGLLKKDFEEYNISFEGKSEWLNIENDLTDNTPERIRKIFSKINSASEALKAVENIILAFQSKIEVGAATKLKTNEDIVYHFITHIRQLDDLIQNSSSFNIDLAILHKLLLESSKQLRVPFSGEPLEGLQVMGFLETRVLDFENIIVLSTNENNIPAAQQNNTYIPYGVRKAFKLPVGNDQDAIYSYHFLRLLQRAKNVKLVYNTELSFDGSGEMSRYLLQLIDTFDKPESKVQLSHRLISTPIPKINQHVEAISIYKSPKILTELSKYFAEGDNVKVLAPTSLSVYIQCPLKFYFEKVAHIQEDDNLGSDIDAREFGNLAHDTLEALYKPYEGKTLEAKTIDDIIKNDLEPTLDRFIQNMFQSKQVDGKNAFYRGVILELLTRILKIDKKSAPLKIHNVETDQLIYALELSNGKKVQLGGKVDRIDEINTEQNGLVRIVDYKTGKAEIAKPTVNKKRIDTEVYISKYFREDKLKSGFQAYFYANLYKQKHPKKPVTGAIFGFRKLGDGVMYLRNKAEAIPDDILFEFETQLKELLSDIFNPEIPFEQTSDTKNCEYCNFQSICGK